MSVEQMEAAVVPRSGLLIGDERVESASGGWYLHHYAGTGRPTGEVPLAGDAEVDRAVRAAAEAQRTWYATPAHERRDAMLRLAELILAHADELSRLQTLEIGIPRQLTAQMPALAADHIRYHAGWLDKVGGEVITTWPASALDYTLDEPYGVVAAIIPWNGALVGTAQLIGPVLAAGNGLVVKPPELAPYVAVRLGELCLAAGLPAGLVNVVPGGPSTGQALIRHPDVAKVHFTGSGRTAREILTAATERLTPVSLELGGKSPHLIFADADLRLAARLATTGAVALSGQGCANGTRVLVERSVYEQAIDILTGRLRRIPVGDPFHERTVVGPVVSEAACTRILGVVERARAAGAGRLVLGGERLGGELAGGYFVAPTVFVDVDPDSEVAQQEIFGPVLAVLPFDSEQEAVRLADATPYGLGAYVHTNNLRRAHRVSRAVTSGSVWVNGAPGLPVSAPFGGTKQSGYGRIGGAAGVREFLRPKNVWIAL